ncbi:MAG: GlsB/YeaQ/YmgE family stress response membrane protein [Candidatus Dasytiphilus stammeri]
MGILSWIFLGLIVGMLAKWVMPGKDKGGIIVTTILGITGAALGGWISILLGFGKIDGCNVGSLLVAIIGAIITLWIYRKIRS